MPDEREIGPAQRSNPVLEATHAELAERLARSDELYRSMFERSPLPMWMFDRETLCFVAVNEAAVRHYGYSREEFLSLTLADLREPEDVPAMLEDVRRAGGASEPRVWRHRRKDGTPMSVRIHANDFVVDGRPVRLVLASDVTDQERAEALLRKTEHQLRHSQKMEAIGRLAGGVAHDFNNVLTVIAGYIAILEDSLEGDPRRVDAVEIRRAAERATAITRQLLTVSRHGIASPRSVDLSELVRGFLPMLRRLIGKTVEVRTLLDAVPPVVVDPTHLEQVLMNLAVNARDAMPQGGRLVVETKALEFDAESGALRGLEKGRYVTLAITDTGTGIEASIRDRMFEPFFTTKQSGMGTGLGLSIVHGIIEQAGGSVRVYSELGHGTTFRVHLPVASGDVLPAEVEMVEPPASLDPLTVLVIDDDAEVRALIARVLHDAGSQVLEAATGAEARRLAVEHEGRLDAAVLDVVLPDSRGDGLLHELRDLRPELEIVLMSGYPAGALDPRGGAPFDLLNKPFTPAELRAAVAKAVSSSSPQHRRGESPAGTLAETRPRILVADDDAALRRLYSRVLENRGFSVVAVASGDEAIAAIERSSFDAILSDVHMPGGGGIDLMRGVRRFDLDVPVILLTGMPDVDSAAQAVEYGAFRYLTKPIEPERLAGTVGRAARAHALALLRRDAAAIGGAHAGAADRIGLEVRFEQALAAMYMEFQPVVEARTGTLFGVEALLRSTESTMPTPVSMLEAASQLGRLTLLGRRVRALCAAAFASGSEDQTLFINLHPQDLLDAELIEPEAPLTALAPRVVLEVTERARIDPRGLGGRLSRLRELGFRLAIDDIGAGYSGLSSYAELTPEFVKIDISLVRGVHHSALKQRLIRALCTLCHESGCTVVGEGVESQDERDALLRLGCDLLQGYLIGRPSRQLSRA
jgi:two-component system, cell cycle sensor histidine kinase and response regulator CckA